MAPAQHVDAIVLGGGTMGSSTAWELGKRGLSAFVFEQFDHVHSMGAHGGETRVFRHAYAESPDYVPLVRRADDLWMELERESGQEILVRCGGLEMSAPGFTHASEARKSADQHGIPYEWLDPAEAGQRWPQIEFGDDWDVLFSSAAGFLRTEPALRSMMAGATSRGVELRQNEAVSAWDASDHGVWVETDRGRYTADRLFITAGPWAAKALVRLGLPLHVRRKTLWWLGVSDPAPFDPARFPVFIAQVGKGETYGFPVIDEFGLKIADHSGGDPIDPDTVDRTTRAAEAAHLIDAARSLFPCVTGDILKSAVCLYTMTPDTHFIIDRHPAHSNVVIGSG
ncbi:MAG: N-methyl-L-tryptophan oxidase, partial [Thermomicrobiales bacterium]